MSSYDYVFLGLSITSSWGNGHATTYRGLLRELAARGHRVLFLERDLDFYADNRDLPDPPYCTTQLYRSVDELRALYAREVREADLVVVGSYVPEGVAVGRWVTQTARGATAFYDIDTPVTLAKLARGENEYLTSALIPAFDLYLSFTGGPTLRALERRHGARRAEALHCSVDPALYFPEDVPERWDLGYLGTYSDDRQPTLESLLLEPARRWPEGRFHVAGPQYPAHLAWPANVEREIHLAPHEHRAYYRAQRFTLNVTRRDMIAAGWSPSVRLFEAAACGVPIISDWWEGLDSFLVPEREILIARGPDDALSMLRHIGEDERLRIAERARARVLAEHTAAHRAETLERLTRELRDARARPMARA
ncbi:MAG: glycosyltransferase [Myxococcota bacterium]|nr:glycosyltransferase [Myxococcota bacterium]